MTKLAFPHGFLWGVATSAAQIEGGLREGGRGESIWDRFAAVPGQIEDGTDPSGACDHFHRWPGDVRLLHWLGVGAYRLSVAWPRIQPEGRGAANTAGLDFYERLVDALLDVGIQPFVTLYHWDLPQALQDRDGWSTRDTAEAFAAYAGLVVTRLGDRVRHWITHNEPWCIATLGHAEGHHAPGRRDPGEALGEAVADDALIEAFAEVERARQDVPLTYFEFGTLAAWQVFSRSRLDAVILEVGMGGRLDAVNIFDAECAVVTSVDLDHTEFLGTTREQIAYEKARHLPAGAGGGRRRSGSTVHPARPCRFRRRRLPTARARLRVPCRGEPVAVLVAQGRWRRPTQRAGAPRPARGLSAAERERGDRGAGIPGRCAAGFNAGYPARLDGGRTTGEIPGDSGSPDRDP